MLQGRRLQLPSASFLVCKSSSRNHALVGLSPTPASDTLARCTRSPIFSLPSPSWSVASQAGGGRGVREGQESGESGTRGARLATRHWPEFLINVLVGPPEQSRRRPQGRDDVRIGLVTKGSNDAPRHRSHLVESLQHGNWTAPDPQAL